MNCQVFQFLITCFNYDIHVMYIHAEPTALGSKWREFFLCVVGAAMLLVFRVPFQTCSMKADWALIRTGFVRTVVAQMQPFERCWLPWMTHSPDFWSLRSLRACRQVDSLVSLFLFDLDSS